MSRENGKKCFEKLSGESQEGLLTFFIEAESLSAEEVKAINDYVYLNLDKLKKKFGWG
jgi:hypothetical protein